MTEIEELKPAALKHFPQNSKCTWHDVSVDPPFDHGFDQGKLRKPLQPPSSSHTARTTHVGGFIHGFIFTLLFSKLGHQGRFLVHVRVLSFLPFITRGLDLESAAVPNGPAVGVYFQLFQPIISNLDSPSRRGQKLLKRIDILRPAESRQRHTPGVEDRKVGHAVEVAP